MKKEQFRCVYCSKLIPSKERASKVCGICWGLLVQIAKTQDMFRRGQ
jgi:Zn finger protein HypA/HybF involved in hydrogenase expression